jgi:hypothetical protein
VLKTEEQAMTDTIRCPNCKVEIEVSAVLADQLRGQMQKEFTAQARRKDEDVAKREDELRKREHALEASRQTLEQQLADRLAKEQPRLLMEAEKLAKETIALEMQDLTDQLTQAKSKLGEAQRSELQIRKERRAIEEQKQELELTVNRRLDEERKKVRDDAKKEADEEFRLREADKDKLVADLRRQIDDMKRTSELGSQQAQGEVMELELEDLLRHHFPQDTIEAVPRSHHGGDVLHRVHDNAGLECGLILYESKRTRSWNEGWLAKLRDDQRAAKAQVAVLATMEMPKACSTFGCIDGVWVTNRACIVGVAAALRLGLIEVARTRRSMEGMQTKMDLLYNYLSGLEFRHKVEGIVEAFMSLREDLDSEKRSMQRIWAKREKQLDRALVNTAGLYGDLGGILGPSLPQIANLELAGITMSPAAELEPAAAAPWE